MRTRSARGERLLNLRASTTFVQSKHVLLFGAPMRMNGGSIYDEGHYAVRLPGALGAMCLVLQLLLQAKPGHKAAAIAWMARHVDHFMCSRFQRPQLRRQVTPGSQGVRQLKGVCRPPARHSHIPRRPAGTEDFLEKPFLR